MKYEQIETLERFLSSVEAALLYEERKSLVLYPEDSISPWKTDQLDAANQKILDAISGTANVYAIFTAPNRASSFSLRYIGKTTRKLARQRIRNHLIKKHEKTGAKFQYVKTHVLSGGQIKISWLKIEPESLRNYLEEELINRHKEAEWNRENA
jgi:hypothetical protein